jgi:hypothetical protein
MDSLDLANYRLLVPQRWKKRIGTAVLLFALLFPDQSGTRSSPRLSGTRST